MKFFHRPPKTLISCWRNSYIEAANNERNIRVCANGHACNNTKCTSPSSSQRPEEVFVLMFIGRDQVSLQSQNKISLHEKGNVRCRNEHGLSSEARDLHPNLPP